MCASMRSRRTPSGCLFRLVWQLALLTVLGLIVAAGIIAVFAPWGFYLGGRFHPLPMWSGWGRLRSTAGNDYVLYVQLQPEPGGSHVFSRSWVGGMAYVCTPRGEQIQLRLVGSMRPGLHTSFDGEAIALDLHYWQAFRSLFGADRRPSFELYGQWRNPNLVLDDRGSLAVAFMPDGSVNRGHLGTRSEPVTITLHEGSFSEFEGACSPHHAS